MEEDPNEGKKNGAAANRQSEVSIFANPAVWSEQAEELYMRGEAAQEEPTAVGDIAVNGHGHGHGGGGGGGSVFSASTFSELSNSIKDALGYSDHNTISDPYGDDSYLQQESSTIEGAQESSIVESQQESSIEARFERMERKQQEIQHKQQKNQKLSHLKHQQHKSNPHISHKQYGQDPPRTPQRTKQDKEQYLKQKEAIHTMTPKTETSNSDLSVMSAPVDERCCGIFRRAFEDEKVFRRLIHTAVFMLIIFSMMSIYVIIKSAENKQVAPTPSPLEFQNPTMIRPPSTSSGNVQGEPSPVPTKWVPTMAPTRLTPEALREIILQAFPGAITAVDDPSSAQARALAWLSSDDSMDAFFVSQKLIQRWALAVLYYSTNGEEWKTQDKWLTNHDECEWYTADPYTPVCNDNGLLYSLHLRNNGLVGTLPDELVLLSNSLELLYLNDGMLEGTIPASYGKLSNLKRFYLQVNQLTGSIPGEIGGMESLENLAIGRNQLSGTIPTEMRSMEELRLIDMSSNRIGGSLPTVLGQMPNLASFLVNENRLTGTIPSEFGELTALTTLLVQDNRLEGDMPLQVCEMRNTKTFFWVIVDCEAVNCIEECRCQCS